MINRLKTIVRWIFWLGINLYGIGTLLLLGLHFFIGERWEIIAIVNGFIHLLLLPAFLFAILTSFTRRWRSTLLMLPAIGIILIWYGTFFIPRTHSASESAPTLTVMTYNIWVRNSEHYADKVELILEMDADVIAVQELDTDSAEYLATALADEYPYQALHHFPDDSIGQGIFSRYPIVEDTFWRLRRGQQRVVIDVNGLHVVIYNVRGYPPLRGDRIAGRIREVADLLGRLATEDETMPLLLVGDFNLTDQSHAYRQISALYHDSFREVGFGFGWTFNGTFPIPLLRIDFVFHNDEVQALNAHVPHNSAGSDHHPLIVELALVGQD